MTEDDDFAATAAQVSVISAAWRFLTPFYEWSDLRAAWPNADPVLRLCWAQWWLHANRESLEARGYDREEVAGALASPAAGHHRLWGDFERVVLRDFRAVFPLDPSTWGIGASPRVLAPGVELLYVHRRIPTGGYWPADATAEVVPLVMRFAEEGWRVLNFGYERIPMPGWPPTLW